MYTKVYMNQLQLTHVVNVLWNSMVDLELDFYIDPPSKLLKQGFEDSNYILMVTVRLFYVYTRNFYI